MLTPQKEVLRKAAAKAERERVTKYKLEIKTEVQRSNLAMLDLDCRTYQSSIVDNMDSTNAVTVPYHLWSKTRREVDPWWEIDFGGRDRNLSAISFYSNMMSKENISIVVLLLKKPVGFENPFLDKVQRDSAAQFKEFELSPVELAPGQAAAPDDLGSLYQWQIGSCTCKAVRIQLRGIKPLAIREFKAFLGDDFVRFDEAEAKKTIQLSLATLSPSRQERSLHSMLVQNNKKIPKVGLQEDLTPKVFRGPNRDMLFQKTTNLDKVVQARYRAQMEWHARTLRIASAIFTADESKAVFYQIFCLILLEEKKIQHDGNYLTTANMGAIGFPLLGGGLKEGEVETEKEEKRLREAEKKKEEEEMAHLRALADPTDATDTQSLKSTGTGRGSRSQLKSKSYDANDDDLSVQSLRSHGSQGFMAEKEAIAAVDRDGASILDGLIDMPEPRIHLQSMFGKIKHTMHLITSMGIHLKTPELIILSENMRIAKLCDDPVLAFDSMLELERTLDAIQSHWDLQDEKMERMERVKQQQKSQANLLRTGKLEASKKDLEREQKAPKKAAKRMQRGASWSQTLMIMALWIDKKTLTIPSVVFNVTLREVTPHGLLAHTPRNNEDVVGDDGGNSMLDESMDLTTTSSNGPNPHNNNNTGDPRDAGPPPPGFLDTRFSEYKLGNFKKRFFSEPAFPKELNPGFSADELWREAKEKERARISAEWTAKIEEKRGIEVKKDEIKIIWPSDAEAEAAGESGAKAAGAADKPEDSSSSSSSSSATPAAAMGGPMAAIAAAAAAASGKDKSGDAGAAGGGDLTMGLPYVCGLCTKRFNYNSTNCKVMYKHIITIRREWDPKLVPKEIETLEQGTSMFNLSNICSFCAQFFNPDVNGGIEFPMRDKLSKRETTQYTSDPKAESLVSKFFDNRYGLDANLDPAEFLHRPSTSKFRDSARHAIEVSARIQEVKEADAAYLAAAVAKDTKASSTLDEVED
jgi:hypothetical protein